MDTSSLVIVDGFLRVHICQNLSKRTLSFFFFNCFWFLWVFVTVHQLPILMTSLVAERWLESRGSTLVAHGLSCPTAYGIFPDQGPSLHWRADSLRAQLEKNLPAMQKTPIQFLDRGDLLEKG